MLQIACASWMLKKKKTRQSPSKNDVRHALSC